MCEQCFLNPLYLGEFLPGFYLGRARRDGYEGKKGDWFLVRCNDPDIYWRETPRLKTSFKSDSEYYNSITTFAQDLSENALDFTFSHELVEIATETGSYNRLRDGNFVFRLYDLLAKYIVKANPVVDELVFPEWEKDHPTDHTIGKE
jgi:hypothetical protein